MSYSKSPQVITLPVLRFEVFEQENGLYKFRAIVFKWTLNCWSWFDDLDLLFEDLDTFGQRLCSWVSRTVSRFLNTHVPLRERWLRDRMRFENTLLPLLVHVDLDNVLKSLHYSRASHYARALRRDIVSDLISHSREVTRLISHLGGRLTPLLFNLDRTQIYSIFDQFNVYKSTRDERARDKARALEELQERRRQAGRINAFQTEIRLANRQLHQQTVESDRIARLNHRLSRAIRKSQNFMREWWRKVDAGIIYQPLSDEDHKLVHERYKEMMKTMAEARRKVVRCCYRKGCPVVDLYFCTSYQMFRRVLRCRRVKYCNDCFRLTRLICSEASHPSMFERRPLADRSSEFQVLPLSGPVVVEHQAGEQDIVNTDPVAVSDVTASSNVQLVDESVAANVVSQPAIRYPSMIDGGREASVVSELCSRYAYFDSFSWDSQSSVELKSYEFPKDLKKTDFKSTPNMILLDKWYYWHFDLDIRFSVNANRYQTGQLMIGWNYDHSTGGLKMASTNELSQAPHSILYAPVNNVVELIIPFKYHYPYWVNDNTVEAENFITVQVNVLNPLSTGEGVSPMCTVMVAVRLRNVRVAGMRSMTLTLEHQMFSMAVNAVQAALRSVSEDLNRDNPTAPTPHPSMIPYSSHSWSVGTNQVELLNPLRLDPLGVTPHFETSDEMTVSNIVSHFGLMKTLEWTMSQSNGTLLLSLIVTPMNIADLSRRTIADPSKNALASYESTPLAVISSMFAYWRGSIEFRFDFVASMFHTGRLAFCYVPTQRGGESVSFRNALQSYVTYFDLGGDPSVTIKCDYICNNTWRPTRSSTGLSVTDAISCVVGRLFVYVVNPLVAVSGVDNKVRFNVYIRGGRDFQLAVPVFPMLFPSCLGLDYIPVASSIQPKTGYVPVYASTWYRWYGSRYCVLRYGDVTDHVAQFTPVMKFGEVYYCAEGVPVVVGARDYNCNYFVKADIGDEYMYLAPFFNFEQAKKFVITRKSEYLLRFEKKSTSPSVWNDKTVITPVDEPQEHDFVFVHQAGDDRVDSHLPTMPVATNHLTALDSFNEDFNDLKTLCRRYQIYADAVIPIDSNLAFGEVFFNVPLFPAGCYVPFSSKGPGNLFYEFLNRARASPMTILANGFRYFRGGLRAKILVRSDVLQDVIVSVTHIPDRLLSEVPKIIYSEDTSGYASHGYAHYAQSTRVNECIEIEIPYYLNSDYGILLDPASMPENNRIHASLGSLAFTLLSRVQDRLNLSIQVFLAFADDMRFSSFQGFSSVGSTLQIPNHKPRPPPPRSLELSQSVVVEHQGLLGVDQEIVKGVRMARQEVEEALADQYPTIRETIRADVRQVVNDSVNDVWEQAQQIMDQLKDYVGDLAHSAKNLMMNVISNIVHVLLNPCLKSVIVALCCIIGLCIDGANWCLGSLVSFYTRFMEFVQLAYQSLRDFTRKCFNCLGLGCSHCGVIQRNHVKCAGVITPQAGLQHQAGVEALSTIEPLTINYVTLIASFFGYKELSKKKSIPNFLSYAFLNYGKYSSGVTGLVEFIKINIRALYSCIDWLSIQTTGSGIDYFICSYPSELQKFCQNAQALLSPLNRERVYAEPYLQRSVFRLASIGQRILFLESRNCTRDKISMYVRDICTKLNSLQEALVADCLCPMVRYEPFVLHIAGEAGIGKSELAQDLGIQMLEAINYRSYSEPMFTRTAGTQYWNGVRTQPIVYYDDFAFARSGELAESHISELMQLKSCATFNPPIAELENKKVRYNPLIVYLSSNHAFWRDLTMVRDMNALHRRRDSLWHARKRAGVEMAQVKEEYARTKVKTYDHLEFGRYPDPKDESKLPSRYYCYEDFRRLLMCEYQKYHENQLTLYQQRLRDLGRLQPPTMGFEYDETLEQEVLDYLNKRAVSSDADLQRWQQKVRQDCDPCHRTVTGLEVTTPQLVARVPEPQGDDELMITDDTYKSCVDEEEIDLERNASILPNWSVYYYYKEDKVKAPTRIQCEHWRNLTLRHAYMEFSDGQPPIYHLASIETEPEDMPRELPVACSFGTNCWLNSALSAEFRMKYSNLNYKHFLEYHIDPDVRDVAPFARWLFPSLSQVPDFEQAATSRKKSFLERLKESKFYKVLSVIGQIVKWFGIISMGVFAVFGGYKMLTGSSSQENATESPWHEYTPSGDVRTGRKAITKNWAKQAKVRSHALKSKFAQPQYGDADPVSSLLNVVKRNAFESFVKIDGICKYGMKGLGLCGRIALTTKHFLEEFEYRVNEARANGSVVALTIRSGNYSADFKLEQCKFTKVEDSSLALIEFPNSMCCFREIRHHIITADDVEYIGIDGRFYEFSNGDHNIVPIKMSPLEEIFIQGDGHISSQTLPMCYSYDYGGKGKCGSVVIATTPIPRIVGIHVAGIAGQNFGYAQAIFREMFESINAVVVTEPVVQPQGQDLEPKIELPYGVIPVGLLRPEECPSYPRKSEIVRSMAFDQIYPHQTEPAVLSKFDNRVIYNKEVEPLVKAIQSHGNVPLAFDSITLNECVDDLADFLISTTSPKLMFVDELLSDQVIFGGLPGGVFNKLNLSSSEGYPLSLLRQYNDPVIGLYRKKKLAAGLPLKGKNWLFDYTVKEEGYELNEIHPELLELMEHNDSLRKANCVPATIFVDTLKDSRVSPQKVKEGKTRMFSISPVEYTWVIKRYFGVFQATYQESRLVNGTAIGINVRGVEWTKLARMLLEKGNNFVVGDYKSFGDTLERQVMMGAFQVIFRWYKYYFNTPKDIENYRQILVEELFNAYHLVTNVVYQMMCGIPSGFALTVEINDLVNQLYMRYCWKKITHASFADYHHFCRVITYGDDLILSVSDKYKDVFNFQSIQECLAGYNIAFQPAAKDGSVYFTLPISEVTFLKAHFVPHPTRRTQFLAKLPLESCLDTINWQYNKVDPYKILFENVRAALNNVYGHGPEVYNFWRSKIRDWFIQKARSGVIREQDAFVHLKTWIEMDNEVFDESV
nr:MAG: polyprotein [Haemaphysalis flava iflavirus]